MDWFNTTVEDDSDEEDEDDDEEEEEEDACLLALDPLRMVAAMDTRGAPAQLRGSFLENFTSAQFSTVARLGFGRTAVVNKHDPVYRSTSTVPIVDTNLLTWLSTSC